MKNLLLVFVTIFAATFAQAAGHEGEHSATVCSKLNANVCAHIGHMSGMTSATESQFVVHAMTPQNAAITLQSIDLWMPDMGHGSSPLEIAQIDVNKYSIKKAYFVMPGAWLVRVKFAFEGSMHQLDIPMNIAQ